MSCGDFDGGALKREALEKDIFVPNYLKRWINIKKAFPIEWFKESDGKADKHAIPKNSAARNQRNKDANKNIKGKNAVVGGMTHMLDLCEIKLEGRHHSGIDDSKNIAAVAMHLMEKGFNFT